MGLVGGGKKGAGAESREQREKLSRGERMLSARTFVEKFTRFLRTITMPTNGHKYSILMPTYNEKDNLPIIIWLIVKYMKAR